MGEEPNALVVNFNRCIDLAPPLFVIRNCYVVTVLAGVDAETLDRMMHYEFTVRLTLGGIRCGDGLGWLVAFGWRVECFTIAPTGAAANAALDVTGLGRLLVVHVWNRLP
jgi:hypothetical protein